ncbi:hypothetical protein KIN20_021484 [Parelaphostrongylus tenuis]|uniref:Uncharacterized protein n=1 Tax=Parelaphostrongylus tenuis TaxID=148309 RepID=A0AAD5MPD8_PARTN|nr:hypothetical protein KIN20_021484 [Parelaphostrongylus tenuis]
MVLRQYLNRALGRSLSPALQLCQLQWLTLTKLEVSAQVPGIATTRDGAKAFVSRLVMQTIINVLESQARSALLPDVVISAILGQLSVRITYEPLPCQMVVFDVTKNTMMMKGDQFCIIVGNTVTGICTGTMAGGRADAMCTDAGKATIGPVPTNHTSVSGTLMKNLCRPRIFMANWSRHMWQSVLNRVTRMLASGPFGSHFFSVTGNVGGN